MLNRAAPGNLRMATSLESKSVDLLADLGMSSDFIGTRYVDLGEIPSPEEERSVSHMQVDEPPRWTRRLMPDHPRIEVQGWHLVPRTPDVTERNQMGRDPLVGLPTMLLRIHQVHHPLPHQKANQSHKEPQSNDQLYLRPLKGDQVCHPVPKQHNDHRLYHQSD